MAGADKKTQSTGKFELPKLSMREALQLELDPNAKPPPRFSMSLGEPRPSHLPPLPPRPSGPAPERHA